MSANKQNLLSAAAFIATSAIFFSVLFVFQFEMPLAFAANQIAPNVILTVTVNTVCEISLNTQTINFGVITASQNTLTTSQNVLDSNGGNVGAYAWVYGGNWIGGASSFGVMNTTWASSNTAYRPAAPLTDVSANTVILISAAGNANVWFGLGVPSGQAANTYTQNIIITNVC